MRGGWPKVFRDPIHNLIAFDDTPCDRLLLELINSPEVQRLRRIKQLGQAELVFPGANHSRFAHSLGVLHTARLFVEQFERVQGPLPVEQRAFILAAALLHDVGHGPFSHVFEQVTAQRHETFTRGILQSDETEVHHCLRRFDRALPDQLARFFDEDAGDLQGAGIVPPYLAQIVSGQLDADRCDYLLRDSHATGTNYGNFDLAWMLAQLRPDPEGRRFYLTRKGLSAVETYLFARFHMYRTVYFHKTSRAAEVMLKLLFRRLKELVVTYGTVRDVSGPILDAFTGQMSLTCYLAFDDHTITEFFKVCARSADPLVSELASGLLNRRLYKALDVTGLVAAAELPHLIAFDARVRQRMAELGIDARYAFVQDSASDTPYKPYQPDEEKPARQIFIENGQGRIVEISTLSEALMQLRKTYTVIRYYAPASFRNELTRIAAETFPPGIAQRPAVHGRRRGVKTGNFWWLAGVIAAHEGRRVVGRTRLQKTVKLLQRLGLPTDYVFGIFFYGPYSEGLFSDIRLLEQIGLITELAHSTQEGATPYFILEARPEAALDEVERWRWEIDNMQDADLVVLELAATYDAFRETGSDHAEALARLRHKKASKWTEERQARALELLGELRLPAA
jgi:hypothetical protein